jgi:hypothetical protein
VHVQDKVTKKFIVKKRKKQATSNDTNKIRNNQPISINLHKHNNYWKMQPVIIEHLRHNLTQRTTIVNAYLLITQKKARELKTKFVN